MLTVIFTINLLKKLEEIENGKINPYYVKTQINLNKSVLKKKKIKLHFNISFCISLLIEIGFQLYGLGYIFIFSYLEPNDYFLLILGNIIVCIFILLIGNFLIDIFISCLEIRVKNDKIDENKKRSRVLKFLNYIERIKTRIDFKLLNRFNKKKNQEFLILNSERKQIIRDLYIQAQIKLSKKIFTQNAIDLLNDVIYLSEEYGIYDFYDITLNDLKNCKEMIRLGKLEEVKKLSNYVKLKIKNKHFNQKTIELLNEVIEKSQIYNLKELNEDAINWMELCKKKNNDKSLYPINYVI